MLPVSSSPAWSPHSAHHGTTPVQNTNAFHSPYSPLPPRGSTEGCKYGPLICNFLNPGFGTCSRKHHTTDMNELSRPPLPSLPAPPHHSPCPVPMSLLPHSLPSPPHPGWFLLPPSLTPIPMGLLPYALPSLHLQLFLLAPHTVLPLPPCSVFQAVEKATATVTFQGSKLVEDGRCDTLTGWPAELHWVPAPAQDGDGRAPVPRGAHRCRLRRGEISCLESIMGTALVTAGMFSCYSCLIPSSRGGGLPPGYPWHVLCALR